MQQTLPMNQIFVDLSKEREIDTHTEEILMDEELKISLQKQALMKPIFLIYKKQDILWQI